MRERQMAVELSLFSRWSVTARRPLRKPHNLNVSVRCAYLRLDVNEAVCRPAGVSYERTFCI